MNDILYTIGAVLGIASVLFFLGALVESFFDAWLVAKARAYPRLTHWLCVFLIAVVWYLSVKIVSTYRAVIGGTAFMVFMWGALSRVERRYPLWGEFFTLSFWFRERVIHTPAKNGM